MKASFDTWTIVFLFGAIQGLFVSIVLLLKKDKHPSRKVLAVISFLFSLLLVEYVLYWTRYQFHFPYLQGWSHCFIFLFGPLFYLYFKSVFEKQPFEKKDAWHGIAFLLAVLFAIPFLFATASWRQGVMLGKITGGKAYFRSYSWMGIGHMLLYAFFTMRHFYALSLSYSVVKTWFRWLNGFFWGFILAYASYFILVRFTFFNPEWDYAISFSMMFFIYFLSWFGYMQPKVFSGFNLLEDSKETAKYKNSPLTEDTGLEIIRQLQSLMDVNKLYIRNDISLDTLAASTGFSKHYISQAINENLKMNFFEYINKLRIREAQQLLLQPKEELPIIEVAYQVGYNNKVSFNKAFKNITGYTPTEYRLHHKKSKP